MSGLTDQQKALLTEEELEGLMEDEGDGADDGEENDAEDDADASNGAADDDEADGGADQDQDDEAAADTSAQTSAEAEQPDQAPDTQQVQADSTNERPPNWILPDDHEDKKQAIERERDDLAQKFDDGDLTAKEYREALKPLDQQLDKLKETEIIAKSRQQVAIEDWRDTVDEFLRDKPHYRDPKLNKLLDQEVRELQAKAVNPLKRSILEEADQRLSKTLSEAFGLKVEPKTDTPAKSTTKKTVRDDPPPSLRNVPAADVDDTDGGEFAYLDRLRDSNSVMYEAELAKLRPDVLDRYMQS